MSLAWHIARKDLFRLRVVLLLWAAVLTGQMGLATIQSNLDAPGFIPFLVGAWIFGVIFLPLLGFGLVMGVQHDDSVCDSDAFWITRPLSAGLLLRAKLVVWLILGLFPSLILAPWWLAHGYDAGQFVAAVIHTTRWQLSLTLLALPLAVLAASTGRFVIAAFVAAAAFVALASAYAPLAPRHIFSASPLDAGAWSRVMTVTWFVGAAAVVALQYWMRRPKRSLALLVAVVLCGFTISLFLPSTPSSPNVVTGQIPTSQARSETMAVVSPEVGSTYVSKGFRFRVNESFPFYPQNWIVSVNESSPDFTYPSWIKAAASVPPAGNEFYFLVSRRDGHSVRAKAGLASPGLVEGALLAGTIRFSRRELVFSMPPWTRDSSDNFKAWVMNADLVKVIAPGDLQEFPREAWPLNPDLSR